MAYGIIRANIREWLSRLGGQSRWSDPTDERTRRVVAFTLVELLVVISIIAILAALLMPALARSRYMTKRLVCLSNFKQIGLASLSYAADNDRVMIKHNNWPGYIKRYGKDFRPQWESYLTDWAVWKCPSVPELLLMDDPDVDPGNHIPSSYWHYPGHEGYAKPIYRKLSRNTAGTPMLQDAVYQDGFDYRYMHNYGTAATTRGNGKAWITYESVQPGGANILYMDGHGKWTDMTEMQILGSFSGNQLWSHWW